MSVDYQNEKDDAYAVYTDAKDVDGGPEGDAVFGKQGEGHVNYTSMSWQKACIVLLKTQIALGVLAMPTALSSVGGVPGALLIFLLGLLTTWSDYVVGTFKRNHPEVYSMADVGFVLAGRPGRELFSFMYASFMIAITGAGFIPIAIAFNTLTEHATCTVVWVVVAALGTFLFASVQTLNKISIVGTVGFVSIMTAILIVTIGVGVQDRPSAAPKTGSWDKNITAFKSATFWDGVSAISTVIFGYCGTPAFFGVISEMRDPRQYNKSLFTCQSIVISTYLTIGIVVYYYCGQYLGNPALGSAGPLLKKVAYGIALPGLFSSVIIYCHSASKLIYVRLLRNSEHLTKNSFIHWAVWLGTVGSCTFLAFILAMSIPFFGSLVVLLGAMFGSFMCMQSNAWMWLYDNWGRRREDRSIKFILLCALNWFLMIFGTFVLIAGTTAGVKSIINAYKIGAVTSPFSCADNS